MLIPITTRNHGEGDSLDMYFYNEKKTLQVQTRDNTQTTHASGRKYKHAKNTHKNQQILTHFSNHNKK